MLGVAAMASVVIQEGDDAAHAPNDSRSRTAPATARTTGEPRLWALLRGVPPEEARAGVRRERGARYIERGAERGKRFERDINGSTRV